MYHGRIRGEARNYDPYSRFGEMMLYDIDAFGYVMGYVPKNWHVMSEQDILEDKHMARRLYEAKYQLWKRQNISELIEEYREDNQTNENFERFCRGLFNKLASHNRFKY